VLPPLWPLERFKRDWLTSGINTSGHLRFRDSQWDYWGHWRVWAHLGD